MIRRKGKQWLVLSKAGKVLGRHSSEAAAKAQLRAIEASKRRKK